MLLDSKRESFDHLLKKISEACGGTTIISFYLERLRQAVAEAQSNQEKVQNWANIESILVCVSSIIESLKSSDVGLLRDVVMLVYQLPSNYLALKRTGANLLSHMSLIMVPL